MKVTTPANNIPRPGYDLIFNDLAGLAVRVCGGSIAFLCSIDAERQWGEFNAGDLNPEVFCGTTFYSHAIEQAELFNISDASADARFTHNPLIVSGSPVRFFAGVPLRSADGHALGMVSILDSTPRRINDKQLETLLALAREASAHLEDRRNITDLKRLTSSQNEQSEVELLAPEERFFKAFDASPEPMTITKYVDGRYLYVNRSFVRKSGYSQKEIQINGDSLVAIESSRFENNINYGIEVTGSARVTIAKSEVHATGFRLNPVTGDFPTTAQPMPGKGIEFDGNSSGTVFFTTVSGSFAAGISDQTGNGNGNVCAYFVNVFDNATNFERVKPSSNPCGSNSGRDK